MANRKMRETCYIVGAGEDWGLDLTPGVGDLVIAADGGFAALTQKGVKPDLIIGDFDSLGAPPNGEAIVLPKEKDVTDTWAAVRLGLERGYKRFCLYNCTGGRLDHTLANVQTAAELAVEGVQCSMVGKDQILTAVSCGSIRFEAGCTGYISVFAHTDRCLGVSLTGLKYPLHEAELTNRFPLGVSNEFTGKEACITVETGTAVVVYDRKNFGKQR